MVWHAKAETFKKGENYALIKPAYLNPISSSSTKFSQFISYRALKLQHQNRIRPLDCSDFTFFIKRTIKSIP